MMEGAFLNLVLKDKAFAGRIMNNPVKEETVVVVCTSNFIGVPNFW